MTSTRVCMRVHMEVHVCAHTRGRGRKRKRRAIHLGMDSWAISQQFLFRVGVMPGPLKTSSKEPSSTFKFSASPIHLFLCIAVGEKPRRHKPALTPLFVRSVKCSRAGLGKPQSETHPAGLPSPLFEQLVNADHETWCEQILAETDASRLSRWRTEELGSSCLTPLAHIQVYTAPCQSIGAEGHSIKAK